VDLAGVYYVGLDEWVGLGYDDKGSCKQVMSDNFYTPAKIPPERMRVFDGLAEPEAECEEIGKWIAERGGIGLALLGVGMNGHVGFNEPNGPGGGGAIVVPLDDTTKAVSVKYFGRTLPVTQGVTISLATLKQARKIIVMASGGKKREIIRKSFCFEPTPTIPASFLQDHSDLTLLTDFTINNPFFA